MDARFRIVLGAVFAAFTASSVTAQVQVVTPVPASDTIAPNTVASGDITYTTNPLDANLQGLGLRIHYDSSKLTPQLPNNVLPGVTSLGFFADGADFDQDPNTDMFGLIEWGNKTNWPGGSLPTRLLTANFVTSEDFSGSTQVNFTASFTSPGYGFSSTSATIFAPAEPGPGPGPGPGPEPPPPPPPPPPGSALLEFAPFQSAFAVGDEVKLELMISGLQDGASPSLGAFDLSLSFDSAILEYQSLEFGTLLGNPASGEVVGQVVPIDGQLDFLQVSFLLPSELIDRQPESFPLMTVTFRTRGAGITPLDLVESRALLADELGDPIDVVLRDASLEVAPTVPTLSQWGVWALAALLSIAAARFLIPKRPGAS